jgi:hypothetical protein
MPCSEGPYALVVGDEEHGLLKVATSHDLGLGFYSMA